MPIDELLRQAMEASGQSQAEIARATGVDPGRLSRFMRRERGLTVEAIEVIANHLGFKLVLQPKSPRERKRK